MNRARLVRLLEVIAVLQSSTGRNAAGLAAECGVSRRTVFRDLDLLRAAGVPLEFDDEQQRYRIPGGVVLPPTSFTPQEALSLLILCRELGNDSGVPLYGAARSAATKLEGSLPNRLREHLRRAAQSIRIKTEPANRLRQSDQHYEQLLAAAAARQCVRLPYDSLSESRQLVTKLSPYQLLFNRRSWYVIGRSSVHRGVRTFNLGRIGKLETLNERFRPPRGFSVEKLLGNAWNMMPERGRDARVVVRFAPLVARNVAEVMWHKTQQIEALPDGSVLFSVVVSGLTEISWWIMGYGDQAVVLEPPELRDTLARRAEKMVASYRAEPAQLRAARKVSPR